MNREDSALETAAKRLELALGLIEQRLARAAPTGDGVAQLTAELANARVREKDLKSAGAEASAALGRAIVEIRAMLAQEA